MEKAVGIYLFYASIMFTLEVRPTDAQDAPTDDTEGGSSAMPPTPATEDIERIKLVQVDPVEVGHVHRMELEPGKLYEVKTAAVKPPLFLIPDFLSPAEYAQIKSLAESTGLHASRTVLRETVDSTIESNTDPYYNIDTFNKFDVDRNQYLNPDEARRALDVLEEVSLMPNNTFRRFIYSVIDLDSDLQLSTVEFRRIPLIMTKITEWIASHKNTDDMTPEEIKKLKSGPIRISQQVWLKHSDYDPTGAIRNRLIKMTGLHPDIIMTSEDLQVVRYTPGGHYHAHHDTTELRSKQPCDHTQELYPHDPDGHLRSARLCRFMTVLYYLADTEEGGQTAFPAADNETYNIGKILRENYTIDPADLTHHCKDANLYLRPQKGMAVMWYNHDIDENTGWLGDLNKFSLHGGCDVIRGEKWIANNWINVDDNYDMQMKLHYEKLHKPPSGPTAETATEEQPESRPEGDGIEHQNLDTTVGAETPLTDGGDEQERRQEL